MSSMRPRWMVVVAAAVAGLATAGVMVFRANNEEPVSTVPACRLAGPSAGAPSGSASGVRVVEQGFSQLGPMASMGVLLHNDTNKVAYRTLVTFDAVDSAGRTVIHKSHQAFRTQVVPIILPGGTVAVGNANLLDDPAQRGENEFDAISIEVGVGQWLPPGNGENGLGKVTASVVAGSGARSPDGSGSLAFDVESTNCESIVRGTPEGMASRGVSLVFRDGAGAIVGGSLDNVPRDACRPGRKTGERVSITDREIPGPTDLDKTLVTVYCDYDRPQRPPAPGVPYN